MRFLLILVVQPLSSFATSPSTDPCPLVCDEYSRTRTGLDFDLCGPSSSRCDVASNICTFLYWSRTEDGQEGLINSEIEPDLTPEELASPLTCPRAQQMVAHRPLVAEPPTARVVAVPAVTTAQAASEYIQGVRGLQNIGAVCYFNTALQIFMHLRPVRELLDNLQPYALAGVLASDESVPFMQRSHLQYLSNLNDINVGMTDYAPGSEPQTPATILRNMVALGYDQYSRTRQTGDMPETLGHIFDATRGAIQTIQGVPAGGELDIISRIFSVNSRSINTCPGCAYRSGAGGRGVVSSDLVTNIALQPWMQQLSLVEGLNTVFDRSGSHTGINCPLCSSAIPTRRVLTNVREIFAVQFLRVNQLTGNRIDTPITFPSGPADLLNLAPFMDLTVAAASGSGTQYRLVAIAHHNGAHYYAQFEHEDGVWYQVDDARVTRMAAPPTGPSHTATMLFYQWVV